MGLRVVDYNREREVQRWAEALDLERVSKDLCQERTVDMKGRQILTWDMVRSVMSRTKWMTTREISTELRLGRKVLHAPAAVQDVLVGKGHLEVSRQLRVETGPTGGRRPFEYRLIVQSKPRADRLPPEVTDEPPAEVAASRPPAASPQPKPVGKTLEDALCDDGHTKRSAEIRAAAERLKARLVPPEGLPVNSINMISELVVAQNVAASIRGLLEQAELRVKELRETVLYATLR
jgi:hypothetical protein